MDVYRATVSADAERTLAEFPRRVEHVQALVTQHFAQRQPSAVRATLAAAAAASSGQVRGNASLAALAAVVADEIELVLAALAQLSRWLQLLVPKVADGNNFGVEVQKLALEHLKESAAGWQKHWDALAEYHSQRAAAAEKLNDKVAKEKATSATTTATTGGKDADETKTVTMTSEKETATTAAPVEDWAAFVVAVDVKWYFNLARTLEAVRDQYAVTFDIVEKNRDKILLPRGSSDRAAYSMF
ncbi:hypothetical protein PybrP1_007978 [[Pythium] brassicae (nom. inval.)]|nr:hypothetical protein PybrP1_007978 [[Pythium] brassicae (nom. inval.)]